jgi:hypothetical protein
LSAAVALGGLLFWVSDESFVDSLLTMIAAISALGLPEGWAEMDRISQLIVLFGAAAGVIVGVLLLSSFLFKFFVVDEVVWRKKATLERFQGRWVIAARLYNGLASPIVDVEIYVALRARTTKVEPPIVTIRRLDIITSAGRKPFDYWPIGHPGVPFTVRVPISSEDHEIVDIAQLATVPITGANIQGECLGGGQG